MLTQQRRELERDGVLDRKVSPEVPPCVDLESHDWERLSARLLRAMCEWATLYKATRGQPGLVAAPMLSGARAGTSRIA
jgi:DNA-binding HxlR family transcriptional regulator